MWIYRTRPFVVRRRWREAWGRSVPALKNLVDAPVPATVRATS